MLDARTKAVLRVDAILQVQQLDKGTNWAELDLQDRRDEDSYDATLDNVYQKIMALIDQQQNNPVHYVSVLQT